MNATTRTWIALPALLLALLFVGSAAAAPRAHVSHGARHAAGAKVHRHHAARHHAARHRATHRRARRAHDRAARSALDTPAVPRLFSPTSFWNKPVGTTPAIDPDSAALVSALAAEAAAENAAGTGPWISTTSYSTPFYVVGPDQPTVTVALDDPTAAWRVSLQAAYNAVPIPPNAVQALGTDAQMTIYQPSTDRLWEFWKARKVADGWHAAWGGAMEHVSTNPGYFDATAWAGAGTHWGATASSLPLMGGTMTLAELSAGTINHALAMEVPFARGGVYSLPAQRTDGRNVDPLSLPEGTRLRLNSTVDVKALKLPRLTEMMALAAQRYGIVVRDESRHGLGFYGEDPTPTGTDPYRAPGGFYGGRYPSDVLARFPWKSLRVLKLDLRPAPH